MAKRGPYKKAGSQCPPKPSLGRLKRFAAGDEDSIFPVHVSVPKQLLRQVIVYVEYLERQVPIEKRRKPRLSAQQLKVLQYELAASAAVPEKVFTDKRRRHFSLFAPIGAALKIMPLGTVDKRTLEEWRKDPAYISRFNRLLALTIGAPL